MCYDRSFDPPLSTSVPSGTVSPPPDKLAYLIDRYDECLLYLDDQIGRLLAELARRGDAGTDAGHRDLRSWGAFRRAQHHQLTRRAFTPRRSRSR